MLNKHQLLGFLRKLKSTPIRSDKNNLQFVIDICSIFRNTLTIEGSSNYGAPLLKYKTRKVQQVSTVSGHQFRIVAIIWEDNILLNEIKLVFNNDYTIEDITTCYRDIDDDYSEMSRQFQALLTSGGRALEIGSRARSGNSYRSLFPPNVEYVGMDVLMGENVDVVGDAHHLSRCVDGKFNFIFSIAVFEHLLMPWKVALEMNKIMYMGGHALIISHAAWPIHEEPWDFWRYSKDSWNGIFNSHTGFTVVSKGYAHRSWTVPNFATTNLVNMDRSPSYLISACLIRKSGEPVVNWDEEVSDVYNTNYNHV